MNPAPHRALTFLAIAFLVLDGLLLGLAGFVLQRGILLGAGGGFLLAASAVWWFWRRQNHLHEAIREGRADLAEEVRGMRETVSDQ